MPSSEPEIKGGPMAHALAWMVQQMQEAAGTNDVVIVETDAGGNELSRVKLINAKLLRVEVMEEGDAAESVMQLRFERPGWGDGE